MDFGVVLQDEILCPNDESFFLRFGDPTDFGLYWMHRCGRVIGVHSIHLDRGPGLFGPFVWFEVFVEPASPKRSSNLEGKEVSGRNTIFSEELSIL